MRVPFSMESYHSLFFLSPEICQNYEKFKKCDKLQIINNIEDNFLHMECYSKSLKLSAVGDTWKCGRITSEETIT